MPPFVDKEKCTRDRLNSLSVYANGGRSGRVVKSLLIDSEDQCIFVRKYFNSYTALFGPEYNSSLSSDNVPKTIVTKTECWLGIMGNSPPCILEAKYQIRLDLQTTKSSRRGDNPQLSCSLCRRRRYNCPKISSCKITLVLANAHSSLD